MASDLAIGIGDFSFGIQEKLEFKMTPLFSKSGGKWSELKSWKRPKEIYYGVDGKSLGTERKQIDNPSKIPDSGNFIQKYRSLIVSSTALKSSKNTWALSKTTKAELPKIKDYLVKNHAAYSCFSLTTEEDLNLKLDKSAFSFKRVFRSSKNELILVVDRPDTYSNCEAGPICSLTLTKIGEKISTLGECITPFDAFDFDGDENTEWVFLYAPEPSFTTRKIILFSSEFKLLAAKNL